MNDVTVAKKTVARFLKALQTKDIKALIQNSHLPFFENGTSSLYKSEMALRSFLSKALAVTDNDKLARYANYKIQQVTRYAEMADQLSAGRRKLADVVAKKNDLVVVIFVGEDKILWFVRIKGNSGRIIGWCA